ncbi:hypothetical protein [Flavobacterium limnophilum]|uniref:hypothetical protein n=1 Tax=Flavobacterium limnophilum TaxID=3003262 RepID=UPI0022AC261C|nr:hypothetical protein [Flavobacterium limnophilum]
MKALHHFKKIGFFLLVTVFISCSDNDDSSGKNLTGTWSWVRTDGGFAFHIHDTPASTGKYIDLKFTSDGKFFYYTNGILSSEGTYQFSTQKSIVDGTYKKSIVFSVGGEMIIAKLDNTNLELDDNNYDGIGSSYTRK